MGERARVRGVAGVDRPAGVQLGPAGPEYVELVLRERIRWQSEGAQRTDGEPGL
ncbi:hypothetical protein [Kribbella jejuensis]|uniref:hypothetical protein n=1 Tax=Kribbella jejuensis TaxID=236068 RepID=UPI001EE2C394|nr:hypothetical protein [Kribbella jejuensis]